MKKYPQIFLPKTLSILLAKKIRSGGTNHYHLVPLILKDQALTQIIPLICGDMTKSKNIENIFKTVGWETIRNRLVNFYIAKFATGQYPELDNNSFCKDLLIFENKLFDYVVEGPSIGFLLSFYLKMASIHLHKEDRTIEKSSLVIKDEVIELLKYSKSNILEIDWPLIALTHYSQYIDIDKLKNKLKKGITHKVLFESLENEQKKTYLNNLLTYALATHRPEMFYNNLI